MTRRAPALPRGTISSLNAMSPSPARELPVDILLDIALRAGFTTLFRFAATCKHLRRSIHSPDFVRRVRNGIDDEPSRLLCFLDTESTDTPFSLLHPATTAAASLVENHLAPFVSRGATGILDKYKPVASRGGLVLLERKLFFGARWWRPSEMLPELDICVYDPLTGRRAFLPFPPDMSPDHCTFVLLTAADGIGGCSSFLLLAVGTLGLEDPMPLFKVQTVRSDAEGMWGPVTRSYHPDLPKGRLLEQHKNNCTAVVLNCVVHWLLSYHILTYDVRTSAVAWIGLPKDLLPADWAASRSCLGSSSDGRLTLIYMQKSSVSILVRSAGGDWARSMEINTTPTVRSLMEHRELQRRRTIWLDLKSSWEQRTGAVLMQLDVVDVVEQLLVLDTATKQIRCLGDKWGIPYEVDLVSRLSATMSLGHVQR